jgi:ParB family chromosome partitioning protein
LPVGRGSIARATNAGSSIKEAMIKRSGKLSDIFMNIPINQIQPVPKEWRRENKESHQGLKESIQCYGIIEPVILRRLNDNEFQLLSGYKRLQAAKELGIELISARILDGYDSSEAKSIYELLQNGREKKRVADELGTGGYTSISGDLPVYLL